MCNGGVTGIGKVMEKELAASCEILDIETPVVINSDQLKEGEEWSPDDVYAELKNFTKTEKYDLLVTYDEAIGNQNRTSVAKACK